MMPVTTQQAEPPKLSDAQLFRLYALLERTAQMAESYGKRVAGKR